MLKPLELRGQNNKAKPSSEESSQKPQKFFSCARKKNEKRENKKN